MRLGFFRRPSAFERLVRQHQHRVYGYACYVLRDRVDAADVTQEVLLKLWDRQDGLDADDVLPWLLRVTRNACIDLLRKQRSYRKVVATGAEEVAQAVDGAPLPDDDAMAADVRTCVDGALDTLREPYRSIVILREIQELKYEEIAGAMDLPLNTVKVYLHRGRKMLRERLQEVMERDPA